MNTDRLKEILTQARTKLAKVIIGQTMSSRKRSSPFFTGNHALMRASLAWQKRSSCDFCPRPRLRIRPHPVTPDLMPADITGTNVFNLQRNEFSRD